MALPFRWEVPVGYGRIDRIMSRSVLVNTNCDIECVSLPQQSMIPVVTPPSTTATVADTSCSRMINANMSPPTYHPYFIVTLQRPSIQVPWGITLSYLQGSIIIGHVAPPATTLVSNATTQVVDFCLAKSIVAPTYFLNPTKSSQSMELADASNISKDQYWLRNDLLQHPIRMWMRPSSSTFPGMLPSMILQPGDCIVQIIVPNSSGSNTLETQPQHEHWDSLASFLTALRQCTTTVQLIVFRNPKANCAAAAASFGPRPHYSAAFAARKVLSQEIPGVLNIPSAQRQLFHRLPSVGTGPSLSPPVSSSPQSWKKRKNAFEVPLNPLFRHPGSRDVGVPFEEDATRFVYDPNEYYDVKFALPFVLPPIDNTSEWLAKRKQQWRKRYRVYEIAAPTDSSDVLCISTRGEDLNVSKRASLEDRMLDCKVPIDFWSQQGFRNFSHWLLTRTSQWKTKYSWNQRKRKVLENDLFGFDESISLCSHGSDASTVPATVWHKWLRVRKNQWKVSRRKRQRRLAASADGLSQSLTPSVKEGTNSPIDSSKAIWPVQLDSLRVSNEISAPSAELIVIDALLEEQEERERRRSKESRHQLDLSFLFDSTLGCPDDVVAKILHFLPPTDHCKLLCISRTTRNQIKERNPMWKQLIPSHWTVPRRPRKLWYEFYISNLRVYTERARKLWDDLLSRAANILLHGDQLQAIEKLVHEGERNCHPFGFDINYASGVVCERNSLLNLAVIHGRHSTYTKVYLISRKFSCCRSSLLNFCFMA